MNKLIISYLFLLIINSKSGFSQSDQKQKSSKEKSKKITMFFSNLPVDDPFDCKTSFTGKENIYSRIYFDKTLKEILPDARHQSDSSLLVRMHDMAYPAGSHEERFRIHLSKADLEKKYIDVDISPDPSKTTTDFFIDDWSPCTTIAYNVGEGKIDLEFTVENKTDDEHPLAYGKININLKDVTKEQLVAKGEKIHTAIKDNLSKDNYIPQEYLKGATFKDPSLSRANLIKLFQGIAQDGTTIINVYISSEAGDDWTINKNDLGVPESKVASRNICVAYKDAEGRCYFSAAATVSRPYSGGGKYGNLVADYGAGPEGTVIPCERIKK